MDKLNMRIQRRNNLNDIYVSNDPEHMRNDVHHFYNISADLGDGVMVTTPIYFQKGPRKDPNSVHGVLESDLLEIVADRLRGHQNTLFATRDNALALTAVEDALLRLAKRADDRAERDILGTDKI